MKKIFSISAVIIIAMMIFSGCSKENDKPKTIVEIEMQDGGKMVLELMPEYAPKTVENFVKLAESGFYDGLIFHRVIEGFVIQGGDPKGNGTGGSDQNILGEFAANDFQQNKLSHSRGVISMARSSDMNSASSQFFIVHKDATFLDGDYAAFGKLIEGFDVLDKIATVETVNEKPVKDVVIKEIKVVSK